MRSIGSSPAASETALLADDPGTRNEVDATLIRLEPPALAPAPHLLLRGPRPSVTASVGGQVPQAVSSSCWSTTAMSPGDYTEVLVPHGGLTVHAVAAPVRITTRRFAPPQGGVPLASVPAGAGDLVRFAPDDSRLPWYIRVSSATPAEVCGVA